MAADDDTSEALTWVARSLAWERRLRELETTKADWSAVSEEVTAAAVESAEGTIYLESETAGRTRSAYSLRESHARSTGTPPQSGCNNIVCAPPLICATHSSGVRTA